MTTRLGLISDVHANPAPVKEALMIFEQHNVDLILCGGDIAGYGENLDETLELLIRHQCKSILGNHEIWYLEKAQDKDDLPYQYFVSLKKCLELNIEGKKIFMVHAQPPYACMGGIRLLDQHGELDDKLRQQWTSELSDLLYDVLIVGHTHQVFSEELANTLVINPGSSAYNHSCAILTLPDLHVEFFALSNQEIKTTWNWGEQFKN